MKKLLRISILITILLSLPLFAGPSQKAIFAGGCFWCIEATMEKLEGVSTAVSGYMGGTKDNAHYKMVSGGGTRHREVVEVTYDPQKLPYEKLVLAFLKMYDPTDAGGSFYDRGFQYTSAIYYQNEGEKKKALEVIKKVESKKIFKKKIVTPVVQATKFYPAEEYHQDYYKKKPDHYNRYRKGSGRDKFIHKHWGKVSYSKKSSKYPKPTKKELKKKLSKIQYYVTQENGTEKPFDNQYWNYKKKGIYVDIVSGEPLFASTDKFKSGTGWPSFDKPLVKGNVIEHIDNQWGMKRTEVRSKHGDSHLGHVFNDGPPPTGLRYCINSASLTFIPENKLAEKGYGEFLSYLKK